MALRTLFTRQIGSLRPFATMPRGDPWNRLYEGMLPYHEHFRKTHAYLQKVLPETQTLPRDDLQVVLGRILHLVQALEGHHYIEVSELQSQPPLPQTSERKLIFNLLIACLLFIRKPISSLF